MGQFLAFILSQRVLVLIIGAAIATLGARAWLSLPIDAFPDIAPTQVKIVLKAPGMTPLEVERQVTRPIEQSMQGLAGLQLMRSTVKYGITDVTIDFVDGVAVDWARQQVMNRLNEVRADLPSGLQGGVAPLSTPLSDVLMFTVEGPLTLAQKRLLLERQIRPLLRRVEGVADVNMLGGELQVVQLAPNLPALQAANISLAEMASQLADRNRNQGLGRLAQGSEQLTVRLQGQAQSLTQLMAVRIANPQGQSFRLDQLAEFQTASMERYGAVSRNGDAETVEGLVIALRGTNTGQLIAKVQTALEDLRPTLPTGVELNLFYNRQQLISTAVGTVQEALLIAIVLVLLIVTVFLGDWRSALLVAINLPLAALATFICMQWTGMSANLMSLGGLVIAIGMLVDASVVVVENLQAELKANQPLPLLHQIWRAVQEVALPVISGTLIVVIVFIPLLALQGLEGKLFAPVALTIVFAMLSSLLLSLTVLPAMASYLIRPNAHPHQAWFLWLQQRYQWLLDGVLLHFRGFLMALLLVLGGAILLFSQVGRAFLPTLDEGDIMLQVEKIPSISLDASVAMDLAIEKKLKAEFPEILQVVARVGSDEIGMDPMGLNETDMFLQLAPKANWRYASKVELEHAIRQVTEQFTGVNISFTQPIDMRVSEMLTGSRGDLAIKIFGSDLSVLSSLASQVADIVSQQQGAIDTQTAITAGNRFINIQAKDEALGQFGFRFSDVGQQLQWLLQGEVIGSLQQGEWSQPIVLRTPQWLAAATLPNVPMRSPAGVLVPLSELMVVERQEGPVVISRENGSRFATVRSNVAGRDLVGFVQSIQHELAQKVTLPAGYRLQFGGQFENQQRAAERLLLVVPLALALIFIILFASFRSASLAALVLGNIPLALCGGIFGLYLGGEYLSVPASVGFIALMGVAVLNGVVMVSYFETLHQQGIAVEQVVKVGASRRLRPVLMTALTAMLGLLPLLLMTGPGSEVQRPLAMVVIGGLFSATMVTLLLMPGAYLWLKRRTPTRGQPAIA